MMNQLIDMNIELTPLALPKASSAQTLYALLRLHPIKNQNQQKIPLDLRMVLDRSGSMGQYVSNKQRESCLDLLKKACKNAVDLLQDDDRITIYTFSDSSGNPLPSRIIKSKNDKDQTRRVIDNIDLGGGTHLSSTLKNMLKVKNLHQYIQRALIFTDGEVNIPSEKAEEKSCLSLADQARHAGIPFWVYGTGISYNERFLRALAERSGGCFEHISDPVDMINLFKDQIRFFQDIALTNVELTLEAVPGVVLRKIARVIPDIHTYTGFQPTYFSSSIPDIDRVRGEAFLIQLEIMPVFSDPISAVDVTLTFDIPSLGIMATTQKVSIDIDFIDDPSTLRHNQRVMDVVTLQGAHDLTTLAAVQAQTGQVDLATTMMQQAAQLYNQLGNDDMVTNLMTLSNAVQQQGAVAGQNLNVQRTLTTASARMVTRHLTNAP